MQPAPGMSLLQEEAAQWQSLLPTDMQRAGPEIYRSVRSSGHTSVRNWTTQNYQGNRQALIWTDLWNAATMVDYETAKAKSDAAALQLLAVSDSNLRRLAAYIYERRTKDSVGAQHMLAPAAPGGDVDVATSWLVQSSTLHSKTEHQRNERLTAASKIDLKAKEDSKGGKGDQGRGRGRGNGRGRGQGGGKSATPQRQRLRLERKAASRLRCCGYQKQNRLSKGRVLCQP
eukprot:TRINITY_DN85738_c0_g1_i1.p1 TRINITY_DN85738_c0_g1~~TRINITY_DN85738_c0_g1_i1.p1  ORF type:complete len:230 (-),score=41.40 TRINITY_DN85738_c0_g1_i1:736-1425(-)